MLIFQVLFCKSTKQYSNSMIIRLKKKVTKRVKR